jgi:hypothetical protein
MVGGYACLSEFDRVQGARHYSIRSPMDMMWDRTLRQRRGAAAAEAILSLGCVQPTTWTLVGRCGSQND